VLTGLILGHFQPLSSDVKQTSLATDTCDLHSTNVLASFEPIFFRTKHVELKHERCRQFNSITNVYITLCVENKSEVLCGDD